MASTTSPHLPNEIILHIINQLVSVPVGAPIPTALPASDPITKTLCTLARTSSKTSLAARKLLYTRCLHINSLERLDRLCWTLTWIDMMYWRDVVEFGTREEQQEKLRAMPHRSALSARPAKQVVLADITSLYLAPFGPYTNFQEQSSITVTNQILKILRHLAPSLQRLILVLPQYEDDSPTPASPGEYRHNYLWGTLQHLHSLDVFGLASPRCWEYYQFPTYPKVLRPYVLIAEHCPSLRDLALWNPRLDLRAAWTALSSIPSLQRLVATCFKHIREVDIKKFWREMDHKGEKKLEVVLLEMVFLHSVPMERKGWVKDGMVVREVKIAGRGRVVQCLDLVEEDFVRQVVERLVAGEEEFES